MTIFIMPHKQFVFDIHFGCGWKPRYVIPPQFLPTSGDGIDWIVINISPVSATSFKHIFPSSAIIFNWLQIVAS
jgi:hypothetical protein